MIALGQQLPPEVARYIDGFVARRRVQRLLRAAARAVLFTIVWALLWCVIDRLVRLTPAARTAALGVNLAIVVVMLVRPMIAMLRQADVNIAATEIERREPRLAERLRTITSRWSGGDAYGSSRELLEALSRQVADEVRDKDPAALLSWRPVLRPAAAGAAWLTLALIISFWSWLDLPTLARRYFMPGASIPAVTTTRLAVTPGDAEITQGDPLRVQATAARLAEGRSLALHVRTRGSASQPWHVEPMTAMQDGAFEGQIARVDRDLEYFITGGDARSELFRITMLPRPAVRRFRIRYLYPPHTALAPREVENETGVIEAPVGTEVTLAIDSTQPLTYATVTIGAETTRIAPAATQPAVAEMNFTVKDDRRYTVGMVSDRGVSGVFRGGQIRAIADRAPVARFRDDAAARRREVAGGEVLPVAYQAVDDYGLARLDIEVRVIRRSGAEANVSLPALLARSQREQQGVLPIELRRFALETGDELELRLQAEDRAGQFALSAPARFIVTSPAPVPAPADPSIAATTPAPPSSSPRHQRHESPPLDPPGYEQAIRAYFDTLRRAAPATQPRSD